MIFYYGHSYIARYDERIRFNGQTNDKCAAGRELEIKAKLHGTQKMGFVSVTNLGGNMARSTQFPIMITRSTIIYEIISPGAAGSSIYV